MSNTYAIASAKGGVGKTTTVANLGTALAAAGEDVAVVDADVGMANLARTLGIDPDEATLHDVLAGTAALEDALYRGPEGVTVLPGSEELADYRSAALGNLDETLATLEDDYEYVIVDTGAGLSHDAALPLEIVDEVLLVSTSHPQALGDTDKTRSLVERLGGTVAGLVLTRATPDATAERVAAEIVGRIPDDPAVDEAVIAGDPVVSFAPESPAAVAYRGLAADVFGVDVPESEPAVQSKPKAGSEPEAESKAESDRESTDAAAATAADSDPDVAEADAADAGVAAADADAAETGADATVAETEMDGTTEQSDAAAASGAPDSDEGADAEATSDSAEAVESDEAGSDEAESDEAGSDEVDTGAAESRETEAVGDAEEVNDAEDEAASVIDDAEPDDEPASVGPHRTEDVPVSEAEPDTETPTDADSPLATDSEGSNTESKGFFRRLLGR